MNFTPPASPGNTDNPVSKKTGFEPGSVAAHMANEINSKLDEMGITPKINLDAIKEAASVPNQPNGISNSLQSLLDKENKAPKSSINIQL